MHAEGSDPGFLYLTPFIEPGSDPFHSAGTVAPPASAVIPAQSTGAPMRLPWARSQPSTATSSFSSSVSTPAAITVRPRFFAIVPTAPTIAAHSRLLVQLLTSVLSIFTACTEKPRTSPSDE